MTVAMFKIRAGSAPAARAAGALEILFQILGAHLERRDAILSQLREELDASHPCQGGSSTRRKPAELEQLHRGQQPDLAGGTRRVRTQHAQHLLRDLQRGHDDHCITRASNAEPAETTRANTSSRRPRYLRRERKVSRSSGSYSACNGEESHAKNLANARRPGESASAAERSPARRDPTDGRAKRALDAELTSGLRTHDAAAAASTHLAAKQGARGVARGVARSGEGREPRVARPRASTSAHVLARAPRRR